MSPKASSPLMPPKIVHLDFVREHHTQETERWWWKVLASDEKN